MSSFSGILVMQIIISWGVLGMFGDVGCKFKGVGWLDCITSCSEWTTYENSAIIIGG